MVVKIPFCPASLNLFSTWQHDNADRSFWVQQLKKLYFKQVSYSVALQLNFKLPFSKAVLIQYRILSSIYPKYKTTYERFEWNLKLWEKVLKEFQRLDMPTESSLDFLTEDFDNTLGLFNKWESIMKMQFGYYSSSVTFFSHFFYIIYIYTIQYIFYNSSKFYTC